MLKSTKDFDPRHGAESGYSSGMSATLPNPHEWYLGFQAWLGKTPEYRALLSFLPVRAKEMRDQKLVQRNHINAMIQTLMDEPANDMFIEAINAYQTEVIGISPVPGTDDDAVTDYFETLKKDGFVVLPPLPARTIEEMRQTCGI